MKRYEESDRTRASRDELTLALSSADDPRLLLPPKAVPDTEDDDLNNEPHASREVRRKSSRRKSSSANNLQSPGGTSRKSIPNTPTKGGSSSRVQQQQHSNSNSRAPSPRPKTNKMSAASNAPSLGSGKKRQTFEDVEAAVSSNSTTATPSPCNNKIKALAILGASVAFLSLFIACLASSIHLVNEGNVGIYFKNGALMEQITHPGIHWMAPFVTEMQEVSVRPQTNTLRSISSITKDGIENKFIEVQVISDVNVENIIGLIRRYGVQFKDALVFDRIREELRIFCANHTIDEVYNTMFLDIVGVVKSRTEESITRLGEDGIKLLNLVIPKPEIPPDIASNYKQVKVQWTEQLVASQQQKTEQIKKETESLKAVADAERQKAVLHIEIQKQILQKEGDRNLSLLENDIHKKREESNADVASYKKKKEAEANNLLYTKEFVQLELAKSLSQNTKFFFSGEQSVLGGLLGKIMGDGSSGSSSGGKG